MILVLGSVNVDLVVRSARLPQAGETVVGGRYYESRGGKGANQAVAAARAGAAVTLLGAVGDDAFGNASRAALEAEGIDCRYLQTLRGQATGVALIMVNDHGENCISVASGANAAVLPALFAALPDEVWQAARVLLTCLEVPWPTVAWGLERAKHFGLRTILNPAPVTDEFLDGGKLDRVDLLTPNEHEAAQLTGIDICSLEDAVQAACALRERGCAHVLVTRGAEGAVLVNHEVHVLPAASVRAVDTTAAGDAFSGALACEWARTGDLVAAARFATAAAGCCVTREGAQSSLARRSDIEAALAEGRRSS